MRFLRVVILAVALGGVVNLVAAADDPVILSPISVEPAEYGWTVDISGRIFGLVGWSGSHRTEVYVGGFVAHLPWRAPVVVGGVIGLIVALAAGAAALGSRERFASPAR